MLLKVPIVTHRLQADLLGAQALTRQITNAKGKVIIVQISRSGEVDQMNIEVSCCKLSLSKVALLNRMLPVHCCDGGVEEAASSSGFAWGRRRVLESEGASAPVGHLCIRHLSANFFYPFTLSLFHHCLYLSCTFREFYYDLQTAFYK